MYDKFGLFIDGSWRPAASGATDPVLSPVSELAVGDAPRAGIEDTEAAISAAARGLSAWSATPAFDRADALHRAADEMFARTEEAAVMISTETGKPLAQSRREWSLSCDQFRWYAEEARRIYGRLVESRAPGGSYEVRHTPVGIVAAFTAWNFPAVLAARKLAPGLAAGCSVILRPSLQTPGSVMVLVDCLRAAGLPPGAVGLVTGPTDATYGPLMASPEVRKVSLTGSTRVGQQMLRDAADTVKRASMELGGNAPLLVFEDADPEAVLDLAVPVKYANAGQVCVTPDRFYVHERHYERFVTGFAERAAAIRLGDGLDPETGMGPVISRRRLEEIEAVVSDAEAQGARVARGGRRAAAFNAGHFFEPTVLADVPDDARAMAEENFGPVAAIAPFADPDDAFARANSVQHGLAAYAFTRDAGRAREAVARLRAGMVGINGFALAAAEVPFGGVGASGMGREGGTEGIHDYLDVKLAQVMLP